MNKKSLHLIEMQAFVFRREEEIRTLDTLRYIRFPGVPLKPLEHLSVCATQ